MPSIRNIPLSDFIGDGPLPTVVAPINYSSDGGKSWALQKGSIWGHPIPTSVDYNSNGKKHNVLPTRNNRLAPADVSKHVAGASTNKDHNISVNTAGMSDVRPSSIIRSSRSIGPLISPTRPRNNGQLGLNTGIAMTTLGQSSLLTDSAPDTESNSPLSSNYANRQSTTIGRSFCQLTVEDAEEFVPSYLQYSRRLLSERTSRLGSVESPHPAAPTETHSDSLGNLYNSMVGQGSDRLYGGPAPLRQPSIVEQADPTHDSFTDQGIPHSSWKPDTTISDPKHVARAQNIWAQPNSFYDEYDREIHPKSSTLRPEVPSYHPSSQAANFNAVTSRQIGNSSVSGVVSRDSSTVHQQASSTNSNSYGFNSTAGVTPFPQHYSGQPHVAISNLVDVGRDNSIQRDFSAAPQPYGKRYAISSDLRLRTASEDNNSNQYSVMLQNPYSNEHYGYVSDATRGPAYQQPHSDRVAETREYYPDSIYSQNPDGHTAGRSALLEEFRLYQKNRKYEIKDIHGHIVEFSGDQAGSRFIQKGLEVANSDEKNQIFQELQSDARQLMNDVFGNYVIQKMFDHGNQSQKKTLASYMQGYVLKLSLQPYGCRCVQKALEHVLTDQQAALIKELDGHVISVVESQHGNHVIQKAIECIPGEHIQFIIDAHKNQVVRLSKHIYGCRIIQRMLEYGAPHAKRAVLDELHCAIPSLIDDQYGNYVIQCIMNKGSPADRFHVIEYVKQRVLYYSTHKFASNVVENAFQFADENQRTEMARQLTEPCPENGMQSPVLSLLKDPFGNYVMQTVLKTLQGPSKKALADEVHQHLSYMPKMNRAKQILAMADLVNTIRAGHSPSSISTGPQTPRTPSSLHSGGSMGTTMAKEIEILSHGYPLREHRNMVPMKPLYS